jgi:hypothetical protein
MARVSARRISVGVGVVAVAGVVWLVVDRATPPSVDSGLAAAVLPAIDDELERGPWPGLLSTARPELEPRWFCVERVIETRRSGDEVRVGVTALCEEYARDGATLFTGSGERAAKVVDLVAEAGGYRVTGVDAAPDGPIRDWWVAHGFTEAGARQANSLLAGETTAPQARAAFGLPHDTPAEPLRG